MCKNAVLRRRAGWRGRHAVLRCFSQVCAGCPWTIFDWGRRPKGRGGWSEGRGERRKGRRRVAGMGDQFLHVAGRRGPDYGVWGRDPPARAAPVAGAGIDLGISCLPHN